MPVIRLISVVLPAPFGPISAWRAPCGSSNSMSFATTSEPKLLSSPRVESAALTICLASAPRAGELRKPAEDAVRQEHHDGDQQHADPEIPELRRGAGELVARHHEDDGADQPAIEPPGAAEDQDHEHVGGALEADRFERDRFGGLREQAHRRARRSRRRWCRSCGCARGSARRAPACARNSRGCRAARARTAN